MKRGMELDQFEPWELEAFAEGGDIPHLAAFARQHPERWSSWLASYRREQNTYAKLRRFDCPSPDELREYYWAMLAPARHEQIATHLDVCTACANELRSLEESMTVDEELKVAQKSSVARFRDTVEAIADHIKWTVATLVSPLAPTLSPAALRGDEVTPQLDAARPSTLLFAADELDLNLIIQKESDGSITLNGQILAASSHVDARIKLVSADPQVTPVQAVANDVAEFSIRGLAPGTYQLLLALPNNIIAIPNLMLK